MLSSHSRKWLGAFLLAALAVPAIAAGDALTDARALAAENKWAEVVTRLEEHLRFEVSDGVIDQLMSEALAKLERRDEAAFFLDRALAGMSETDKEALKLRKRLLEIDPLAGKRDSALKKTVKSLLESAQTLHEGGHVERALVILERLRPIAREPELGVVTTLAESIRAATTKIDLDAAGGDSRPADGWPEVQIESQRYLLRADLEPAIAEMLGRTMDEIFEYYVKIYFDGDRSKLDPRKATIFVHASHDDMGKVWGGGGNVPGGWWSPGEWQVHCYDTRGESGTLDEMLATLFHEASHQFMTMLAGGGGTPAWLNEGTSSFFEGAVAMADGRVLWPDAALSRLTTLEAMLKGQSFGPDTPKFLDVISYNQPGSYPAPYYPWGWGLVYFLQQYEDPQTLEYVHRPKYIAYRDEVIKRQTDPREAFEKVFVGAGKYTTLAAFETDWKRWIQDTIYPLHVGARKRELRMALVERYLAAATAAAREPKKAKVPADELLLRALGHVEYVRSKVDGQEHPEPSLLLLQADIFDRLGRAPSTAPLLEQLLDMAGDGRWTPSEEQLATLEKRLKKLDSKNSALRLAKARSGNLAKAALELLDQYEKAKTPLLLRSYSFAKAMSAALDKPATLEERAAQLRTRARESGLLRGATYKLGGAPGTWKTIFSSDEKFFGAKDGRVEIGGVRPVGRLCTTVPISGEYEVRARMTRVGEAGVGAHHGVIVSGTTSGDWLVVSIDNGGKLWLKRIVMGNGGVSDTNVSYLKLSAVPPADQPFDFVAKVAPSGAIEVTVGEDGPFLFQAPLAIPGVGHVGVYVKYGELLLENAVVEILP